MEDADLIRQVGAGDKLAMKALYERHSDALFHFLRFRLGDAHEAADVMQEAFLEVWRNAGRFEGRSSAKTWIFGIARNKAIDRMRRRGKMVLGEPDQTIPDDAPSPEKVMENASDVARVRACMEKLSDAHRTAVRMAFYEDMSYPEIAEAEAVPVGTIKTRVHHAKQLLKHCLGRT
ncbi:RNA polymerase sigma factor [Amaricoccus macauensis]|uniref:RNA polymerase sigma factor n=1 Tax=Amaricoccus macauensis TaxID=57001 RepID=UPI003C7EAB86